MKKESEKEIAEAQERELQEALNAEISAQDKRRLALEQETGKEVQLVIVKTPNKNCYGFFKKANLPIASKLFGLINNDDWANAIECWLLNCWIEGDTAFQNDDDVKLSLIPVLNQSITMYAATIKKK